MARYLLPHHLQDPAQDPCCVCGFTTIESLCAPKSPFENNIFDYSHNSLSKARHIVEEGRCKVNAIDEVIQKLQKHRDQIKRVVLDHEAFLPPIARIPNDVLFLVFDQAMGWGWEPQEGTIWAASAVCRLWRDLALSSRRIWTRIALNSDRRLSNGQKMIQALIDCRRVRLQLDRSGQEPLECALRLPGGAGASLTFLNQLSLIRTSIHRLLSALDRCVLLELWSTTSSDLSSFELPSNFTPPTMAVLRSLTLAMPSDHYRLLQSGFLSLLPALEELTFTSAPLPHVDDIPALNLFRTVTYLKLSFCDAVPTEIISVLSATPSIKSLDLHPIDPHRFRRIPEHTSSSCVVTLPFLQNLQLFFYSVDDRNVKMPAGDPEENHAIREVIRDVRAPNVEKLGAIGADGEDMVALQACFSGSPPSSLRTLHFQDARPSSIPHIVTLISRTRGLETLGVYDDGSIAPNIDPLVNALRWPCQGDSAEGAGKQGDMAICSQLRTLKLLNCTMSRLALREMLASRGSYEENGDSELVRSHPPVWLDCYLEGETFVDDGHDISDVL